VIRERQSEKIGLVVIEVRIDERIRWLKGRDQYARHKDISKSRRTDAGALFSGQHLEAQLLGTDQGFDLVGDNMSNRAGRVRHGIRGQGILAMNNEEPNTRERTSQLLAVEDGVFSGCWSGGVSRGHGRRDQRHAPITAARSPNCL